MIKPYKDIHPQVHPTVFIAETAAVIGDVVIGEDSSIWFHTVVRGDEHYIRIGKQTNIQDLCQVHTTEGKFPVTIGDQVTIGHKATIHGCTIGNQCLIGMGAILLDGCKVGDGSVVAAGSVVREGSKVPPRTLVAGVPAKPVRELRDKNLKRILHASEHYMNLKKDYM